MLILFTVVRLPVLRLAVVIVFTAPVAVAGYALVHGVAREAAPSHVWRLIFYLIGGGTTGLSAVM